VQGEGKRVGHKGKQRPGAPTVQKFTTKGVFGKKPKK
jgi:hypothetical protein